jgi:hypothetical protein
MRNLLTALSLVIVAPLAYGGFAVDLPIVTHTTGSSTTFYTALDVTNNTSQTTDVNFEYISNDLAVSASGKLTTLGAYGDFHSDDILSDLASRNAITAAQAASFGTMLITFSAPTFTTGTEAAVTARIYNFVNAGQRPSVALAYRGQVLRKNGRHTVSSVISNTSGTSGSAPSVITNAGLENVGIDDAGNLQTDVVTLKATFYDPKTGNVVGSQPTFTLGAGQMLQINDVWKTANLPADATSLVMTVTETAGSAQIRGYVVVKDTSTNDGAFFFME